jgi:hypothetical protein
MPAFYLVRYLAPGALDGEIFQRFYFQVPQQFACSFQQLLVVWQDCPPVKAKVDAIFQRCKVEEQVFGGAAFSRAVTDAFPPFKQNPGPITTIYFVNVPNSMIACFSSGVTGIKAEM